MYPQGDCNPDRGCQCYGGWRGDDCSIPVEICDTPVVTSIAPPQNSVVYLGSKFSVMGSCLGDTKGDGNMPFECVVTSSAMVS